MNENDFQNIDQFGRFTEDMWFSKDSNKDNTRSIAIMSLGLAGETGEVIEYLKKYIRDGTEPDRDLFKKELGDVLYYWARIVRQFGFQPSEVIAANVAKLEGRRERGTLRGSGDNR